MSENIKQFLEADALRTPGEWKVTVSALGDLNVCSSDNKLRICNICCSGFGVTNENDETANFIAAASRIAPDIRQLLAAFEQVCEALDIAKKAEEQIIATGVPSDLHGVYYSALAAAAPYRKLMGGV